MIHFEQTQTHTTNDRIIIKKESKILRQAAQVDNKRHFYFAGCAKTGTQENIFRIN